MRPIRHGHCARAVQPRWHRLLASGCDDDGRPHPEGIPVQAMLLPAVAGHPRARARVHACRRLPLERGQLRRRAHPHVWPPDRRLPGPPPAAVDHHAARVLQQRAPGVFVRGRGAEPAGWWWCNREHPNLAIRGAGGHGCACAACATRRRPPCIGTGCGWTMAAGCVAPCSGAAVGRQWGTCLGDCASCLAPASHFTGVVGAPPPGACSLQRSYQPSRPPPPHTHTPLPLPRPPAAAPRTAPRCSSLRPTPPPPSWQPAR